MKRIRPDSTRNRLLAGVGIAALATTVVAAVPAFSAAVPKKPLTESRLQPKEPVPKGFSSWSEVYELQARLNAAAERVLAADEAGNASIVAKPESRELRVYWKGAVPAAVRGISADLDVPVTVLPAKYTHRELVKQARRLADDPQLAAVAPEPDGSGLTATVTERVPLSERTRLRARSTVPMKIEVGLPPQAVAGRQADTQNYWGGSRYNSPLGSCTNGLPIRFGNSFHMITAGHCGNDGNAANIPGQASPTGTFFSRSACRDTALIDYRNALQTRVYTGPFDSSSSVEVLGATPDFVGNLVVTSGASSGEHLNVRVEAIDVFTGVGGIACTPVGPLTRASGATSTTCVVAPGDSGGPVYAYVGTNVVARGTITAGNVGSATCPGTVPSGGSTVFYAPLFRPARDQEVGSLDFYRAVPPAATTFNLSGRWSAGTGPSPVILVNDTSISVNMSAFGRPTATGSVINSSLIRVTFPDDATYTGQLVAPNTIRWSNNSQWTKIAAPTIFDLNGKWTDGRGPGPIISVTGNSLSVNMAANNRPTASGSVINGSTISVTFPDDATYTGQLLSPNRIQWSNGSFWLKL
jgi:hypothetical protein